MTTRRENILDTIKTTLAGTTGVSTRIFRSRVTAVSRAETPCLLIEPVSDTAEQTTSLATLNWTLVVRVSVIVRGDVPDEQADLTVQSLHSKMMSDTTVGGYAMDIIPTGVTFDMVEADQPAGVISCDFQIRYRTKNDDLTTS
jgi:hypothetical protein